MNLRWYEEPVDPLDLEAYKQLGSAYGPPLATGENLFSLQEVKNLIRYGGLRPDRDILQMDPGLAYGVPEYLDILHALETAGWSRRSCFPHGGNLFNLHIAQGLQIGGTEVYPGVFAPLGGFGESVEIENGRASAPDFFQIDAVWESFRWIKRHYTDLGFSARADILENNAGHNYNRTQREAALRWFNQWLKGRVETIREPRIDLFTPEELWATPGGQVLEVEGARGRQLGIRNWE